MKLYRDKRSQELISEYREKYFVFSYSYREIDKGNKKLHCDQRLRETVVIKGETKNLDLKQLELINLPQSYKKKIEKQIKKRLKWPFLI
ncbi:MAG: hypothetical protein GY679_01965 [Mycoplasma sp.]|nr:hypothetical protein [Mycoplasma sp.]